MNKTKSGLSRSSYYLEMLEEVYEVGDEITNQLVDV